MNTRSTTGRDDFNRLIDATRRPEDRPAGILLWNYARFARDLDDAIYYKALLRNRNIIVHSITDPIPDGQYGRIIEFFIDISNEEKRRQTSTDAKRGLRDLVLKHGCVPGTPPVGFKRQPVTIGTRRDGTPHIANRWIPDPNIIPRIQLAFQMRANGSSLAQIHTEIKLFGSINSYKTFFANKIFIGILEFGDLVIENYCDPIIDIETWNAVQTLIREYAQARTKERHPKRIGSGYLLSGLAFCELCGAPLSGNTTTRTHITGRNEAYLCSRAKRKAGCTASRIPRHALEESVVNTLKEYILLPDALAAAIEVERHSTDHHETRRTERLALLNDEKKKLATKIANITRAIADKGHSQTLLDALTELESKRATTLAEISELTKTRFEAPPSLSEVEIQTASDIIIDILQNSPTEQVRQILHAFLHKVIAKKVGGEITGSIRYYLPPLTDLLRPPDPPIPFDPAPMRVNLPTGLHPVGAPLYRQTYTHPIVNKKDRAG